MGSLRKALVIDDEAIVATTLHRVLREVLPGNWLVEHETNAALGLSRLVVDKAVTFAIVDFLMPGTRGDVLVEEVIRRRPELRGRIVICTGLPLDEATEQKLFMELGCLRLDKPVQIERMEQVAWQVIESLPPET